MGHSIAVLMAVDEKYAAPMLVTVQSLLQCLQTGVTVNLFVMADGFTREKQRQMEASLEGSAPGRVQMHWVTVDHRRIESLQAYAYLSSPAACFRILVGSSLPLTVSKVIYLDADLLILKDIVDLWEQDMKGNIVLAVQDSYIQRFGKDRPYFNSGVMVIDLIAWRTAGIENRCLEAVRQLRAPVKWLDQHILNVCLAGRWAPLPPAWNKQFFLDLFPDWQCSPYSEEEFHQARNNPAILHFCSRTKPWEPFCDHRREDVLAYRAAFLRTSFVAQTANPSVVRHIAEYFAAPHRRLLDTLAAAVRANRRKHAFQAMLPALLRLAVLHPWTVVTVPVSIIRERTEMWWRGRGIGTR